MLKVENKYFKIVMKYIYLIKYNLEDFSVLFLFKRFYKLNFNFIDSIKI